MRTYLGLFNTNQVNLDGFAFPIEALESHLNQCWQIGSPTFVSHDMLRPAGWSRGVGLLLCPEIVGVVGRMDLAQTVEDLDEVKRACIPFLSHQYGAFTPEEEQRLRMAIGIPLHEGASIVRLESICAIQEGIAAQRFSQLFGGDQDKDGLVDLRALHQVGPGVFERDGVLLFAHQYFRRSQSRLNNLNAEFLSRLGQMTDHKNLSSTRIALDPDMLGLPGTWQPHFELEYWWGPKFNDDLPQIHDGVTRHEADERLKLYHGITRAEFWWHTRDDIKSLEAEEVRDLPSSGLSQDHYACRYVHSMLDGITGLPTHLDGAVRIYDTQHLLERIDQPINTAGRHTDYHKLWRLDGPLPVSQWKELISHYYRDNRLIGEYFGGEDVARPANGGNRRSPPRKLAPYLSRHIESDEGVHVLVSYHATPEQVASHAVELHLGDTYHKNGRSEPYIEFSALDYCKLLQARHPHLDLPAGSLRLAFEDTDINLPLLVHRGPQATELAGTSLEALRDFVCRLNEQSTDRFITAELAIEGPARLTKYAFAGHVRELAALMATIPTLAGDRAEVARWCETVYTQLQRLHPKAKFHFDHLDLVRPTGALRALRKRAPIEALPTQHSGAGVTIASDDAVLTEAVRKGEITIAPFFHVLSAECARCQSDYMQCPCLAILDAAAAVTMKDIALLGCTWTTRPA